MLRVANRLSMQRALGYRAGDATVETSRCCMTILSPWRLASVFDRYLRCNIAGRCCFGADVLHTATYFETLAGHAATLRI